MKSIASIVSISAIAVLTIGGCATGMNPTRNAAQGMPGELATYTPAQMTALRATMLKAATTRAIPAPGSWVQRRWSPRRHFGPLYGNSPDVHLNQNTASMVYNRYFIGNPDAAVFQKYYGSALPSSQPTVPNAVPGTVPNSGFGDVRLSLDTLTYSSRYGGTFKLTFRSQEDFQVEFRKGTDVWDIGSLEMAVYVRPVTTYFNPNAPLYSVPDGYVHVEYRPQRVVGYTISGGILTLKDGDPFQSLMTALVESAQALAHGDTTFRREVTRLSHGLVHAAFWEEIGQTNKVTAIEISDNFFFPRTTAGRGVAVVSLQFSDVRLDTEPGNEEIYLTLDASHMFRGVTNPPTFSWTFPEINDRESTWYQTVGVFPLDWDCGQLQAIIFMLSIREADDTSFDDRFVTDPRAFQTGALDCAGMQTAFNNGQFGLYRILPDQQLLIVQGSEIAGAVTARLRISVVRQ